MELGKGYSYRTLNLMRKFYLFQKMQTVSAQFANISWSHYVELLHMNNYNEINYYLENTNKYHLGVRDLRKKIKFKEYQRLDDNAKNKLINKEELELLPMN